MLVFTTLRCSNFTCRKAESWEEHRGRLEKYQTSRQSRPEYTVVFRL
jgi:hypothetical protein